MAQYEDLLEGEYEDEFADELEALVREDEDEGEEFFKGLRKGLRGVGRFVKRGVKVLRPLAKIAAPIVGSALGGPLGGLAGNVLASALEGESEEEYERRPLTAAHAQAEALAAQAARTDSEAEAEALVGAAAATLLSRPDHKALRAVHADLVRGAAVLAELLHRRRETRPYTGVVPTIVDRTAHTLARHVHSGRRLSRPLAAKVMAAHTANVLGDSQDALVRHVKGVRSAVATYPGPLRSPVVRPGGGSTVEVVTPVRVPARHGRPARVVRVVSKVPVPTGAVPAGRTAVVRTSDELGGRA
jgi:hypothetical protein